jgi:hypothetical protein
MTAHALVQGVLAARRDLRLKHKLAVLDVSDAVTILVTPPPHPERSTDGRWLGPDDNYPDDNYPDDNYPDDNYPGALSPITTSPATSSTTTTTPKLGRSTDGTWPDNPSNGSPTHQGGSHDETQEDQEPYSTNRGRWGDVDVVDGRI